MSSASDALILWPIYSDVGVRLTPTLSGGSWQAALPLSNLQSRDLYRVARSTDASPASTRFRVDLGEAKQVRGIALVYRSPERTGAPTTAARFRYLGIPSSAQGVLFDYETGDNATAIAGYAFTRATAATYVDSTGVLRTAATGVLRDSHFIGGVRHVLLEAASTNLVLQSENFGATWADVGTPTRVAAAHIASGVTLDLLGDDSAAAAEAKVQTVTFTGNAIKSVSLFVKQGSSTESIIRMVDGANVRLLASITWSGGLPVVAMTTGTYVGILDTMAGGVFHLGFITTTVTAAGSNQLQVWPATTAALAVGNTGDIYVGGVQAEDAGSPTSYLKTTTVTVARNADSLSFSTIASAGTIYQKYWNLATLAYVETTGVYSSGAAIPFTVGRAYVSTRISTGTKTQAEMQALIYDSGWLTPYPAGKTIEDTEGVNLMALALPASAVTPMRIIYVDIDDPLNAAGYIDLNRFAVAGVVEASRNMNVGATIGLETGTTADDSDGSVTTYMRRATRRSVTCIFDEQEDAYADAFFDFQRVAGIDRQFIFVWDPTDTTRLWRRAFLATMRQLSKFEANIGNRWGIPHEIREVL